MFAFCLSIPETSDLDIDRTALILTVDLIFHPRIGLRRISEEISSATCREGTALPTSSVRGEWRPTALSYALHLRPTHSFS